jgi:hypothetical protein
MKPNHTLHKTPQGFVLTSDEDITKQLGFDNYRIIAQQDQLILSDLKPEEQQEIGWYDVEKWVEEEIEIAHNAGATLSSNTQKIIYKTGLKRGAIKILELLSDRKWTDADIEAAIMFGINVEAGNIKLAYSKHNTCVDQFIAVRKTTSWPVETEPQPDGKIKVIRLIK